MSLLLVQKKNLKILGWVAIGVFMSLSSLMATTGDMSVKFLEEKGMILSIFASQKEELRKSADFIEQSNGDFLKSIDLEKKRALERCKHGMAVYESFHSCMERSKNGDELEQCNVDLQDQKHYDPLIDRYLSFYQAVALQHEYARTHQSLLSQNNVQLNTSLANVLTLIENHSFGVEILVETATEKSKRIGYPQFDTSFKTATKIKNDIQRTTNQLTALSKKNQPQNIYSEYMTLLSHLKEETYKLYQMELQFKKGNQ